MEKSTIKTLQDLVSTAAELYGDKTFFREKNGKDNRDTSFSTLCQNAKKVSHFLHTKSAGQHIHAAVIGSTSAAYLTCYFGTVCGGNVIVPIDAQLSAEDIGDQIFRADVEILFYDRKYTPMLPTIRTICPQVHTYVQLQDAQADDAPGLMTLQKILDSSNPVDWTAIDPESCATIIYTSGTTGISKGVMLSHRNLIDNTMCQDNESSTEEVLLTVLPIHHVYCFVCDILLSLRYGATVCVNDSMMRIAQNLKRFEPSLILLVPMIAETIYKKIKAASAAHPEIPMAALARGVFGTRLRGIYSGGAYLSPALSKAYADMGILIAQGYGMTECSPRISTGNLEDVEIGNGDVGKIVNGCQVKIVDGEIWVKSRSVMMGYYHNPEATAETLTEDGWLKTGDLGYVDDQNRLYITGRKKNLIILSNGENVSPEELENKFAGLDWVGELLVYDEESTITAELYPHPEFPHPEEVPALFKAQVQAINQTVSPAKAIRRLRIRDKEFDKTTSRKIRRNQPEHGALLP